MTGIFGGISLFFFVLFPAGRAACCATNGSICAEEQYQPHTYFRAYQCAVRSDNLFVTITLPDNVETLQMYNKQFPVVLFVNGFMLRSCVYAPYAKLLTSHGYVVVQYDDAKSPRSDFSMYFDDEVRLAWMQELLSCTAREAQFAKFLDWDRLAVVGHSRGAKLAGLFYTAHQGQVAAAYLIDPVDTPVSPSDKCLSRSPDYKPPHFPNLAELLANSSAPLGMSGANITSKCNCNTTNFRELWPHVAAGSWLTVVGEAGHLQVTDDTLSQCQHESWFTRGVLRLVYTDPSSIPVLGKLLAQWTCSKGSASSAHAMQLAGRPMLAWLDRQLQGRSSDPQFSEWLEEQKHLGAISFQEKPTAGEPGPGMLP